MRECQRRRRYIQLRGDVVFDMHQTHGIPPEITADILAKHDLCIDMVGYQRLMEKHRQLSRKTSKFTRSIFAAAEGEGEGPVGEAPTREEEPDRSVRFKTNVPEAVLLEELNSSDVYRRLEAACHHEATPAVLEKALAGAWETAVTAAQHTKLPAALAIVAFNSHNPCIHVAALHSLSLPLEFLEASPADELGKWPMQRTLKVRQTIIPQENLRRRTTPT